MNVLLDSDVLIEVLRGRNREIIEAWQELADSEDVALFTPISVCELFHGAKPGEFSALEEMFSALICPPIDAGIGRRAGEYMRRYSKSHALEIADAMIAATAVQHEAALWTRNRKHYPMKNVRFY